MAIGISDLGNGLGYLYMVDNSDKIIAVKPNSLSGARAMRQLGLANAPMAAQRSAYGQIIVDACTSVGNITAITINGVNIIATSGNIACATSVEATFAGVIAAAINSSPAPSGPIYTATAFDETVLVFSDPADGSTVNGYTITVAVDNIAIETRAVPFVNGSDQSGVFDSVLGYRFFIDANYNGVATPDSFSNAEQITNYFTLRGLQAGIFKTEQTITTDRIGFERNCAITQVVLSNEGGAASDILAYIDPSNFIDGDEVILVPAASAQVPIVEDATVTTSPIPSKNIYLTDAQPFSLSNNKSISLRFKYDVTLGPIFIESGRSIAVPPAGLISTTRTALVAIVNASSLSPGSDYLITDRGDAGLIVQATSSNTLSLQGTFIARVPDYQNTSGNFLRVWYATMAAPTINKLVAYNGYHYRSLTGAVGTAPSGDAVNWLQLAKTDSSYITETHACEYNYASDWVQRRSDRRNNTVSQSKAYNTSSSIDALNRFQWGRDNCYGNKIEEAINDNVNFPGITYGQNMSSQAKWISANFSATARMVNNTLSDNISITDMFVSTFEENTLSSGLIDTVGDISNFGMTMNYNEFNYLYMQAITLSGASTMQFCKGNLLQFTSCTLTYGNFNTCSINNCTITGTDFAGTISNGSGFDQTELAISTFTTCTFTEAKTSGGRIFNCAWESVTLNTGVILSSCVFDQIDITGETFTASITGKTANKLGSTFEQVLDLSDGAIFSAGTLTLATSKRNYIGVLKLSNAAAQNITAIVGPTNFPFYVMANNTGNFTITPTAVGGIAANQVASDAGALNLVGRATANDYYLLKLEGGVNKKISSVKYI